MWHTNKIAEATLVRALCTTVGVAVIGCVGTTSRGEVVDAASEAGRVSSDASLVDGTKLEAATDADWVRQEDASIADGKTDSWNSGRDAEVADAEKPDAGTPVFHHPGVALGRPQLDFVKAKIASNAEPWSSSFSAVTRHAFGKLTYSPSPVRIVKSGSVAKSEGYPEEGLDELSYDSQAAYTHALIWYYSGTRAHAQKAIEIMNAWSSLLEAIYFDEVRTPDGRIVYNRGKLAAAWSAETVVRAAEIIRHTFTAQSGEVAFDVKGFEKMLLEVYYPVVENGWTGGGSNWLYSMAHATMVIGVFTDRRDIFDNGLGDYRRNMTSAFHMVGDSTMGYPNLTNRPPPPPGTYLDRATITDQNIDTYWHNATSYLDGQGQEMCRDLTHTMYGLESMAYASETARLQGIDLYAEFEPRLLAALELHAGFLNAALAGDTTPPQWPCPDPVNFGGSGYQLGWEVAFNHFSGRRGAALPEVAALIAAIRPTGTGLHMNWASLTFAGVP